MSQVKSFTIGNVTYNAVMASAIQQDEIAGFLTSMIMQRGLESALNDNEMGDNVIMPMFMGMDVSLKKQVVARLMTKVVINGGNELVNIDNFQSNIIHYNTLLAQLLQWNLADFFTWLGSALKDVKASPPADPAP